MNLSIRGICGSYVSQSSETGGVTVQISARLRSVHAQDIQQSDSQLRHFLSSIDPILIQICDPALGMNSGDEDLVVVEVSKNPNADQDISIHFHELYVEWNPELLARVQKSLRCPQQLLSSSANRGVDAEFFDALDYTASYNTNSSDEKEDLNETADVAREHHKSQATDVAEVPSPQFSIVFHLSQLRVNFNKDSQNRCLFSVDMNQTDISYHRKPLGGAITTATVANARLRDSGEVSGGTLYGQMIGLQSGNFTSSSAPTSSIVHMSFESFTRQNDQDSEFHNMMKLNFSEMKFVYIHQLWLEIFDYVFEGVLGHAVWGSKPKPVPSASNRGFKRTKMSIHMEQPLLLLPICYR